MPQWEHDYSADEVVGILREAYGCVVEAELPLELHADAFKAAVNALGVKRRLDLQPQVLGVPMPRLPGGARG